MIQNFTKSILQKWRSHRCSAYASDDIWY